MTTKNLIASAILTLGGAAFANASVLVPESTLDFQSVEKATAALEDYTFDVPYGGNFYAGAFEFNFYIEDLASVANNTILAGYWGGQWNQELGANIFAFIKDGDGNVKLQAGGGGKLSGTTSPTINNDTSFVFSDRKTLINVLLSEDVLYTVKVTGANGKQTISLWNGETELTAGTEYFYNGNMNGNKDPIDTGFNQTFNPGLAVPEPSTFGLLAGLGALALVASRRRRSRKIA